jgi:uncharacterized protein (DUF427 family)
MTVTGPLGRSPAGRFHMGAYLEPSPKRVRAVLGGQTIADSKRTMLLFEPGRQPVYMFPPEDVNLFRPEDVDVPDVEGLVVEAEAAPGLVGFRWERVDHWYEEDEEIFGHVRDPYHRVDVRPTSRRIRISRGGVELAATERAMALFETNLVTRWYIPRSDVIVPLSPSDRVTYCPYKGQASYYSVPGAGGKDLIWCYEDPFDEVRRIAGLLAFWNERVDIELDGELVERPESPWAHSQKLPEASKRG